MGGLFDPIAQSELRRTRIDTDVPPIDLASISALAPHLTPCFSLGSRAERKKVRMDKTYKTNVQFTRTQLQELSTVSAKTQLGRSELVGRAVDHYLIEIRKQGTLPSLSSLQTLTNDAAAAEK